MNPKHLPLIDAIINLVLGILLLAAPITISNFLGIPPITESNNL